MAAAHTFKLKIATGTFVALIYLVSITSVLVGFAGYVLRTSLNQELSLNGRISNVDTLVYLTVEETSQSQHLDALMRQLQHKEKQERLIRDRRSESEEILIRLRDALEATLAPITLYLNEQMGALPDDTVNAIHKVFTDQSRSPDRRSAEIGSLVGKLLRELKGGNQEHTRANILELENLRVSAENQFLAQKTTWQGLGREEQNISVEISATENDIQKTELALKTLDAEITDQQRATINAYRNTLFSFPYYIIQVPTIILTLVVTIATGLLGSTVSFTRKFLGKNAHIESGNLFKSAAEGISAAIAIFLFAGAGMLVLSQGGNASKGNIEIGPYTVAFLAFVSGFMADAAFNKIEEAGRKLFAINSTRSEQVYRHRRLSHPPRKKLT